jgi:hypothetical protein
LLFVSGPPANHTAVVSFDCSDNHAWPVIDAIWAGLNGLGAAIAISDSTTRNRGQVIEVGLAWLAMSGFSAIDGFSKVSDCHAARRQHDDHNAPRRMPASTSAAASLATPPGPPSPLDQARARSSSSAPAPRSLAMRSPAAASSASARGRRLSE